MKLPEASRMQFTPELRMSRILNGLWQVSGAHGPIDRSRAVESMADYLDVGFLTWDLADHYGPAEDFIGEFRRKLAASRGPAALSEVQAFTKWVPRPGTVTRKMVDDCIAVSLRRMDVETLDLLQFHWWDYGDRSYLDALTYLAQLQNEGKIAHIGLTNFDTEHLKRIVDHGIKVVSNQVQYSLIDRRPEVQMMEFCQDSGVHLLTYGTLCGGLLSEKYLGQPQPTGSALNTASLSKYAQMIGAWGGWDLFQQLLVTLKQVGDKHGVSVSNVAVRSILDRPAVAGVIIGARLGVSDHREENARVFEFTLDDGDREQIEAVLQDSSDLYQVIGDCGDEYRR